MNYTTYWISNSSFEKVEAYVTRQINGVQQDRIVSISHSSVIDGLGKRWISAMIVIRDEDS